MQELFQLKQKLQKILHFYFFGKMSNYQSNQFVCLPKLKTFYPEE